MSRSKNNCRTLLQPLNQPLGAPKIQKQPPVFRESYKMKAFQLPEWTAQKVLKPHIKPKNSPLGPRKSKMTPKSCQNQMSKLKEAKKTKVVALYK